MGMALLSPLPQGVCSQVGEGHSLIEASLGQRLLPGPVVTGGWGSLRQQPPGFLVGCWLPSACHVGPFGWLRTVCQ